MKIKDLYLSLLSESEDYLHLDADTISRVEDVDFNKSENYLKLIVVTTYGKKVDLITKYSEFKSWYLKQCASPEGCSKPWLEFAKEFISKSQTSDVPVEETVNEIIDDEGNIMADDDKPNNATNSMVGSKNTWDLDRTAKTLGKNKYRYYGGGYGQGFVTW